MTKGDDVSTVATDKEVQSGNLEEVLISVVRSKPALWSSQVPVTERSKIKKKQLWMEVHNVLGGLIF